MKLGKELKGLNYSPAYYPVTKVGLLSTVKDPTPEDRKAGIYAVQCGEAGCKAIYIGQTGRKLQEKEREHTSTTRKSDPGDSAIRKHCDESGHSLRHVNPVTAPHKQGETNEQTWRGRNLQ